MNKKEIFIVIFVVVILIRLYSDFFIGLERKHPYIPYIDTKFAENFKPSDWHKINIGMSNVEVNSIVGHPIDSSYDKKTSHRPDKCFLESHYSNDGAWPLADFAWCSFNLYYDSSLRVMKKDSTWWDD